MVDTHESHMRQYPHKIFGIAALPPTQSMGIPNARVSLFILW